MSKTPLGDFLARNPFPHALTDGLFYREKMRAIHRVAPASLREGPARARILDIGGGRGGLASLLYPDADVVSLDVDPAVAKQGPAGSQALFICGDACKLPFPDGVFDAVTLFDVLEHIEDDAAAAAEAMRVTRPGGVILASTPASNWRYPYFKALQPICPPETELMEEWGHVRRGYDDATLDALFGAAPERRATFINPMTAIYHDIAFSRLGRRKRGLAYLVAAPVAVVGYALHGPSSGGAEIAGQWRR